MTPEAELEYFRDLQRTAPMKGSGTFIVLTIVPGPSNTFGFEGYRFETLEKLKEMVDKLNAAGRWNLGMNDRGFAQLRDWLMLQQLV